jgi:hypothetical protein
LTLVTIGIAGLMRVAVLDDLAVPGGAAGLGGVVGLDKVAGRASFSHTYLRESFWTFLFVYFYNYSLLTSPVQSIYSNRM